MLSLKRKQVLRMNKRGISSLGIILLIVLLLFFFGGLPGVSHHSYGYGPSGGLGLVLLILVVLILLGRL